MNVEWNPHIINKINKGAVEKLCKDKSLLRPIKKAVPMKEKAVEFLLRYNRAKEMLCSFPKSPFKVESHVPIAYRLEPQLSDITDFNNDVLASPKFGGVPDMTWWFSFCFDKAKIEDQETQKLDENIKEHWPICGCCHKPLWFLGQMDITEWAQVIHLLTYDDPKKGEKLEDWEKSDRHYYQLSGLGSGDKVNLNLTSHDLWWYFFYCDCFNFNIESSSAVVLLKHKFQGSTSTLDFLLKKLKEPDLSEEKGKEIEAIIDMGKPDKERCLWPIDEYYEAVEKFMRENERHPELIDPRDTCGKVPLQFIKNFKLHFDLDYPGMISDDLYDAFYYDTYKDPERKDIFGGNSTYSLFGSPRSQQTEPRFVCSFGYEEEGWKIHRMAPIICWNDNEHDITRQMYGCFRCVDSQSDTVWARMDNSCT
jgi:hypothetical protein